jgi:hypothetical protein
MNLLHNEGCDYGTFTHVRLPVLNVVVKPAKQFHNRLPFSFYLSFHISMSLREAFHVMPSSPPVHMLTVVGRQPIAPP